METEINSRSKLARWAAFIFIFVCLPFALWGELSGAADIFVSGDPKTTAGNLLPNEFIHRVSVFSHIAGNILFAGMMLIFYRLFKPVDPRLARLMIIPVLIQVPVVFVFEAFNFAALSVLKGDPRSGFDASQQQEVAHFLMRLSRLCMGPTKFFLGLSFIPFGVLVWRSGYAPRIFAILLLISGAGYIIDSTAYLLLERSSYIMVGPGLRLTFIGFLAALVWFLVMGVRREAGAHG